MGVQDVRVFETLRDIRLSLAGEGFHAIDRLSAVEPNADCRYVQAWRA
jgi:hypothetical protein